MASIQFECTYCGRRDFKSAKGLTQHQNRSTYCRRQLVASINGKQTPDFASQIWNKEQKTSSSAKRQKITSHCHPTNDPDHNEEPDFEAFVAPDDNISEASFATIEGNFNQTICANFRTYIDYAYQHLLPFTHAEASAIRLLIRLRQTKASLQTYESVMEWHLKETGRLQNWQSLADSEEYISREKLFKQLKKRYNIKDENFLQIKPLILPHSRTKVNIVINDAQYVLQSLLSDPRIRDEDYLFFDDDPFAPPPEEVTEIKDLNTGQAYRKTYAKLIKDKPNHILLPVLFYMDGANTGQFVDLPLTAVKISLGIFTRKAREKDHFWKTLGFIPAYSPDASRSRRLLSETSHMEGELFENDFENEEGLSPNKAIKKAQDLHSMLEVILESYLKIQKTGFIWDLFYKNKVYPGVKFVLFTPFMKLDSEEADLLCGKFTVRTENIKQICRYCECPTIHADDPLAKFPAKTPKKIQKLVDCGNLAKLQSLSQQNIQNACYKLRFGFHNKTGIHGACPMEMLHALYLGIFKYVRDAFFEQIGSTSQLKHHVEALCKRYGVYLSRQSSRDMPRTKFLNGVNVGKLMAKDYSGVLLCLSCVIMSSAGRAELAKRKKFQIEGAIDDWQMLLERLMQWEMWLKSDKLRTNHVARAKTKHRYLMFLIRKIGNRTAGMGLKIVKFHAIMHMAQDIMDFGVPMEVDTGANESGHKAEKQAAKLTQNNRARFDLQSGKRLMEMYLLNLAQQEMIGHQAWTYFEEKETFESQEEPILPHKLGGSEIFITYDTQNEKYVAKVQNSRPGSDNSVPMEQGLQHFVANIQDELRKRGCFVPLRTTHKRHDAIFRASTKFMGQIWRDWAIIDWGHEGKLPCQIMGFFDLKCLSPQKLHPRLSFGGLYRVTQGIYAVVEVAYFEKDAPTRSEIFIPIFKKFSPNDPHMLLKREFFLADVEAFVDTVAVIPDIGCSKQNGYFMLRPRHKWGEMFGLWLDVPHEPIDLYQLKDFYSSDEEEDTSDGE